MRLIFLVLACAALPSAAAMAQSKNPGTTLSPDYSPAPSYSPGSIPTPPPVVHRVVPPPAASTPPTSAEADGSARRLAETLPLDPATRDLRNREPADVHAVIRQLGLREPHGTRVDLRGRTPTPKEIADALAH